MQHRGQPLEPTRPQQLPEQRVRFGRNPHLAGQRRPQMLQSVAITVGVGKSHVAQALGQLACRRGRNVAFLKASRALAHLAGGHADHSWASRLRKLAGPALLVLDDFGMRELTPSQADDLYELITERARKFTLVTANRAPADWYPLFPNPVVAESLLDRSINTSHVLLMDGPSYRPRKRPARVSPDPQPTASD